MSEQSFGRSVADAYLFLSGVTEDIATLMKSLTQQLAEHGLEDWYPLRLSIGKIDRDLYAMYGPSGDEKRGAQKLRYAVLVQIRVLPTDSFDEPVLLAVAVDFGVPTIDRDVWSSWNKEGGLRLIAHLGESRTVTDIPAAILKPDFAPAGKQAAGFVTPVCAVHNADEVRSQLVKPIVEAATRVGFAQTKKR